MEKQHVRLTQKDLVFGIYWGRKGKENQGLHVWMFGRYVWPRESKPTLPAKKTVKPSAPRMKKKKSDQQLTLTEDPRLAPVPIEGSSHSSNDEGEAAQTAS